MNYLQGGRLDVSVLQAAARNNLLNLLEQCRGTKAIVWDEALSGPTGLICQYAILKEHSVLKMYPLRVERLPECNVAHIIFIARPKVHLMDLIAKSVQEDSQRGGNGGKKQYHLFFVPRKSLLCTERLKHKGVFGSLMHVEEFRCHMFPFDSDLISMEIPEVFREYYLENDPTCLYLVARSIVHLQKLYGVIPAVWGKGQAAKYVWDLVQRLWREENSNNNNNSSETKQQQQTCCIDQILLIDRAIDLISPLATQLTYEGLIDELYGLNNTTASFPAEKFQSSEERQSESLAEGKKQLILNSGDKLYADIRDKNFNAVGAFLSKQAKQALISSQLEDRQDLTVQEMKLYVQRLPQIMTMKKALSQHTAIAECIKEITDGQDFLDGLQAEQEFLNCIEVDRASGYIEDLIAQKGPLIKVLRLLCLQCLTGSGLKPKLLEYYKREIVQVYGLESLLALNCLEKVGLLKGQSLSRQYTVLRKALRLTTFTDEINPSDISYVHSVYAPLSVRLAEHLAKHGSFKQLHDVLGLLPGPTLDGIQQQQAVNNTTDSEAPRVILVFFIGGCTFAEISALRFLSQQEDSNVEFVIATTKLINGDTFLKSIIE